MFILIFFLILSITQFINNKMIEVADDSEDAYNFDKKDSLIIAGLFVLGIVLQIFSKLSFISKFYWFICLFYLLLCLIIIVVLLQLKKTTILKKREEMQQVYEILQKLVDKKGEGLDFNNPPFQLGYKYGNIQKITVNVEPTSFDEKIIVTLLSQLNAFLPTYTWGYETHLEQRYIEFIGNNKPPTMARWPGSWLRHFRYMPVGLSGLGEIAYQPDSIPKTEYGRSQFIDDHGNPVDTDRSLPTQPQGLVCGAPLGLNTIIPTTKGYKTMETIEVGDYVFDFNNKPVQVIGVSPINYRPNKVYKLVFKHIKSNTDITIISDEIHQFPYIKDNKVESISCQAMEINHTRIVGHKSYKTMFDLIEKTLIKREPVRCIRVDSPSHLFLVTDTIHTNWKGGNYYPYAAIYTHNTGGGKSVMIQNIIAHCIEHRDKIALGLVDPKQVEFSNYKGMNGIVGVANNTLESVELLRIARQVMLKRNKEMAKLGIKSLTDYQPSKKSGKCYITGREYNEDDMIKVRIDGQEKMMKASELVEYLKQD